MSLLQPDIQTISGVMVVPIHTDLGLRNVDALAMVLMRVGAGKPKAVVLDLTEVEILSSLAMGELMKFNHGLKGHGGRLALCGVNENVMGSLERARLDKVLAVHATRDAAVGAMGERAEG